MDRPYLTVISGLSELPSPAPHIRSAAHFRVGSISNTSGLRICIVVLMVIEDFQFTKNLNRVTGWKKIQNLMLVGHYQSFSSSLNIQNFWLFLWACPFNCVACQRKIWMATGHSTLKQEMKMLNQKSRSILSKEKSHNVIWSWLLFTQSQQ